jgi:hypothetical protein
MIMQAFAAWKPDSKPAIPRFASKTRIRDKMYSAVMQGFKLRIPTTVTALLPTMYARGYYKCIQGLDLCIFACI